MFNALSPIEAVFGFLGGLIYLGVLIFFIIVFWRLMKSTEDIRDVLKQIAEKMKKE